MKEFLNHLAVVSNPIGDPIQGPPPFDAPEEAPKLLNDLISAVVSVLTVIAAIYFIVQLITAAYSWMSAGGDKNAIEEARRKIINSVIALTIVVSAIFLVDLVGEFLGFTYILNPGELIWSLRNL